MGVADHGTAAGSGDGAGLMRFFEDMEVGLRREVGSYTFTADAI